MCGTCGCGSEENGPKILTPTIAKENHDHMHGHTHDHHHHDHSHDHDHHQKTVLEVERDILQQNEIMAARNRGYFDAKDIFALNLVSSPGSGKTSILERTLKDLKDKIPFYVIEDVIWKVI